MLSMLYSKKTLNNEVFNREKLINSPIWLALSFNENPKYGEIEQKISYTHNSTSYGILENYKSESMLMTLSKNKIVKSYQFEKEDVIQNLQRIEVTKQELIKKQIEETIASLAALTPETVAQEEKAWEWFRVSMDVLINAISKIDNIDTILQYKLFWGLRDTVMTSRLIIYNLDIEINILDQGLLFTVYNFKDSSDKTTQGKTPDQKVLIKGVYNDIFNKYIEVLKAIRKAEDKILN